MSKEQRRMVRFIVIPFSSTCRSGSSVDVVDNTRHGKKPQGVGEGAAAGGAGKPKGESLSLVARLLRGFKNLSQIFAAYEEDDEEEEQEMVIGLPTDVKHVAHIGWDGSTSTTTSVRSWNRAAPPPGAASTSSSSLPAPRPQPQTQPPLPPALSMPQFELAMAAQAAAGTATAASSSTSTTTATRHGHS